MFVVVWMLSIQGFMARLFISMIVVSVLAAISIAMMDYRGGFVGIFFYPWYDVDGRHWNGSLDPGWATVDKPVIGYYSSWNDSVIDWQLKLIKEAGIDFIILSWWGPNSFEDNVSRKVFSHVCRLGLKAVIQIEPYKGVNYFIYNNWFWKTNLEYIDKNFIKPYSECYMKLYGKPLILSFNPVGELYKPRVNNYTIRVVGNGLDTKPFFFRKNLDWDLWPDYIVGLNNTVLKIRRDHEVSITPRFDDYYLYLNGFRENYTRLDPMLKHLYISSWNWILRHAYDIKIVLIYSWNEYHERSMIEPHIDYTSSRSPYYLYNITKENIWLLKTLWKIYNLVIPYTTILSIIGLYVLLRISMFIE